MEEKNEINRMKTLLVSLYILIFNNLIINGRFKYMAFRNAFASSVTVDRLFDYTWYAGIIFFSVCRLLSGTGAYYTPVKACFKYANTG